MPSTAEVRLTLSYLATPDGIRDPARLYRGLLAQGGPVYDEDHDTWLVAHYPLIRAGLADARFSARRVVSIEDLVAAGYSAFVPLYQMLHNRFQNMDGADHARLRRIFGPPFYSRNVIRLMERMTAFVRDYLEVSIPEDAEVEALGGWDLADLATVLPTWAVTEILGIPEGQDRFLLQQWALQAEAVVSDALTTGNSPERITTHFDAIREYFRGLMKYLRTNPNEGVLSSLLTSDADGPELTDDVMLANVLLLYSAGRETTTNLITMGTYTLVQANLWKHLAFRPGVLPNAVHELLRYCSPVKWTDRYALEDLTLGTANIQAGDRVSFMIAAGNRDATIFEDPHYVRLERTNAKDHLAFGYGPHFCIGQHLSRLEMEVYLRLMGVKWPGMRIAPALTGVITPVLWLQRPDMTGLTRLRVVPGDEARRGVIEGAQEEVPDDE